MLTPDGCEDRRAPRRADPFPSPVGPPIAPQGSLVDAGYADVVVVTDLALQKGIPQQDAWALEADWLRAQFSAGATVCSICTGALLLAEAGLVDGMEATTHWSAAELFRKRYPNVHLCAERILCLAGPEHRVITRGGSGSWEDLALYLIARYCGAEEARHIARIFVLGDRSDGQLVYSAMGRPRSHDDAIVSDSQSWIAENYACTHPVRRMVERSGLSERTFKRRFRAATGYTPIDYVQSLRIEEAKQVLETTHEETEEIAYAVGYEDPAYFRRLFKRKTGITPARYRRRFQAASYLGKQ